jgi:hypothetical protein
MIDPQGSPRRSQEGSGRWVRQKVAGRARTGIDAESAEIDHERVARAVEMNRAVDGTAGRAARNAVTAIWGGVTGAAPHVLHHVGPLAGAAFLAGTGGRVVFFLIGLAAAVPMVIRLYRRFQTWAAPALAIVVFAGTYTVSTLFLGPLFTAQPATATDTTETAHDHDHEASTSSAPPAGPPG